MARTTRESRLRRAAERQGFRLRKSRRRDPRAIGYGRYQLVPAGRKGGVGYGSGDMDYKLTLDEVEKALNDGPTGRLPTERTPP